MYKLFFKRVIDFTFSLIVLIVFSPVFIFVMLGLFFVNDGKPFFFQKRAGKNDKIFEIIKFKTMNDKKDSNGDLLPDTERLTSFGAFVRKTSLDELPQLFNIFKGEMSLIGPRPLLPEYLEFYSDYHKRRHLVRPGITGLAQVKGRNQMKFSERFNNDVYYVENISFGLDIKIIFLTVKSVLFKSSTIVNGQTVDEVDDLGISRNLSKNHFKK
ncbi:sugar transferase [Chryseobacterium indologenes]|uniref:sugar transferase n=1 Tax=Chryseobacterium TaxID=59732 RepID=UPI0016235FF4|nr:MULTISPECIES: sugar transferase [Chryseobacterium]MDM1556704.1 sugar transferase [Chryseobacterium indologenes]WET51522.1 sugar transferase [Chryseobacterium indologenes]